MDAWCCASMDPLTQIRQGSDFVVAAHCLFLSDVSGRPGYILVRLFAILAAPLNNSVFQSAARYNISSDDNTLRSNDNSATFCVQSLDTVRYLLVRTLALFTPFDHLQSLRDSHLVPYFITLYSYPKQALVTLSQCRPV
jgi:hypothetical protein